MQTAFLIIGRGWRLLFSDGVKKGKDFGRRFKFGRYNEDRL
jgi:hypothetical protein